MRSCELRGESWGRPGEREWKLMLWLLLMS